MATSGTYTFSMNRDQIVASALRKTGAFGAGDTIPQDDINNVSEAFNVMVKEMAMDGMPLWCLEDLIIPTVVGQSQYNLSTIAGMPLPPRILNVFIRSLDTNGNGTGNDVQMMITSRFDYYLLGRKDSQGVPNQCYYDPQLTGGILTVYDVPADNQHELHVTIQRQIQDINLSTDNPDFPQEAYRMLIWCLLDEISLEYRMPKEERLEVNQKAVGYRDKFMDGPLGQEQASVFFTPSERNM